MPADAGCQERSLSDEQQQPAKQRRKKLNIPLIKGVVMMGVGMFFAFLAGLTGISPQIAAIPVIVFLLGFQPAKAQGTAIAYTLCTAIGAVAGATWSGLHLDYFAGFLIAVGATVGAILASKAAAGPRAKLMMRTGQSLAILISVFVLMQAFRQRIGGPQTYPLEYLISNRGIGALLVGLAAGVLTQLFQITAGIVIVPVLIFFVSQKMTDAISTSIVVILFASLLPTLGYAAKQAVDKGPGYWMCVGGVLGGLAGGLLLGRLGFESYVPLVLFGLGAMILSGWTLSRLA
jgi:uncharacterized membrane protein YfcA